MRRTIILLVISFLLPSMAQAGPWTPAPLSGYAKAWVKWLPGFGFHTGDSQTLDYGAYNEIALNVYGELGVFRGVAVWLHAPLLQIFTLADPRPGQGSSKHVSIGDPALGLRWQALNIGRVVAALSLGIRIPIADADPVQTVYGTDPGNPQIGELKVGAGVVNLPASISVGYGGDRFHLAGEVGYRYRSGDFDHDLLWGVEGGFRFSKRWSGLLRVSGVHAIDVGAAPRHLSPSGIGNGTSYIGIALEGGFAISKRLTIGASLEGGLLAVRRQSGGPVISLYAATAF